LNLRVPQSISPFILLSNISKKQMGLARPKTRKRLRPP
jgi:hypothetical protein